MAKNKKSSLIGLFVRVIVVSSIITALIRPTMKALYPLRYEDIILEYSKEFDLSEYLVMGIISSESNFNEGAKSHKSAKGLMQIKEETAVWCVENLKLGIELKDIYHPRQNIYIGCAYLAYLEDLYGGNTTTAIAAYNAGLGNVNKWISDHRYSDKFGNLKKIPFDETRKYVKKVEKRARIYKMLY